MSRFSSVFGVCSFCSWGVLLFAAGLSVLLVMGCTTEENEENEECANAEVTPLVDIPAEAREDELQKLVALYLGLEGEWTASGSCGDLGEQTFAATFSNLSEAMVDVFDTQDASCPHVARASLTARFEPQNEFSFLSDQSTVFDVVMVPQHLSTSELNEAVRAFAQDVPVGASGDAKQLSILIRVSWTGSSSVEFIVSTKSGSNNQDGLESQQVVNCTLTLHS